MSAGMFIQKRPATYVSILLIAVITAVVSINFSKQKTVVLFDGLMSGDTYYVGHKDKLFLKQSRYYNFKKALNNLVPGKHILHYNTSPVTRYYALIDVKQGRNIIKPEFRYYSLPSHSIFRAYDKRALNSIQSGRKFEYTAFDDHGIKKHTQLEIDLNQAIGKTGSTFNYSFEWTVILNNQLISSDRLVRSETDIRNRNGFKRVIFENTTHRYYVKGYHSNGTAKLKIWAEYI